MLNVRSIQNNLDYVTPLCCCIKISNFTLIALTDERVQRHTGKLSVLH